MSDKIPKIQLPWQERWEPHELGHSLPIAQALKRWAIALALAALIGLVLLVLTLRDLGRPGAKPAAASVVQQQALDRLARVELPLWDPGAELPAVEPPPFARPPEPPLWTDRHPADPPPRDPAGLRRALGQIDSGNGLIPAATFLAKASERQGTSWSLAYNAGVAFERNGFSDRAADALARALDRLEDYAPRFGDNAVHHAAVISTRYAAGRSSLADDCVEAIRHLKLAVAGLRSFVDTDGAEVFERTLPFRVAPLRLDNLDVWGALTLAYVQCEGDYPKEYFERYPDAQDFRQGEYEDAGVSEVREGAFPQELADCIESNGATSRCWAVSNLNRLYVANRPLLESVELPRAFTAHRPALARLAFNLARLAATGPDLENAARYLEIAHRLDRTGPAIDLSEEIRGLGLYLGATAQDYTALAEPYRGLSVAQMPFDVEAPPEAVKGMAEALRERWQGLLERGRPETIFEEVEAARQEIPDEFFGSLERWREDAQATLRDALAEEIRRQKRLGREQNISLAAGLRDFRADYLGAGWAEQAKAAWWTPGLKVARVGLILLYLLFLTALVLLYRYGVYPYLMYTTDYYKAEIQRRIAERKGEGKNLPVTGREFYDWKRKREGEVP